MSNEKLFEYATEAMYEQGGDGGVLVVLRQQRVSDVADEFERWQASKHPGKPDRCMRRLPPHPAYPSRVEFSDMSNENIHFVEWNDYERFLRRETHETGPLDEETYRQWDAIIVTW